nr:MAG: hypothetical protein [Bacteriophage sp.]
MKGAWKGLYSIRADATPPAGAAMAATSVMPAATEGPCVAAAGGHGREVHV